MSQLLLVLLIQAVPVGAVPLGEVAFAPSHDAPASVVARNESQLSAEITAVVKTIRVDVGSETAVGDRLVALDCRSYQAAERAAQADLSARKAEALLAERQLARARRLRETETVSEDVLDTRIGEQAAMAARVLGAQAALDLARLDVSRCNLSAPFAGVVTKRDAQLGELTSPGAPLLTLVETAGLQVAAQLSPEQADQMDAASRLLFVWRTGEVEVELLHLLPVVDGRSRSREARLRPLGETAPPGTAGRLAWRSPGLAIPAHLVVERDGQLGIFLIQETSGESRARFHAIDGAREGRPAFVDLPESRLVITDGRLGLSDQDAVTLR